MSVEAEILKVTGQKPKKSRESATKYLARLARAGAELADDDFADLSEEAQEWINDAAGAINEGQDLPGFDDEEDEEPKAKRKATKKTPAKTPKATKKTTKKTSKKTERKPPAKRTEKLMKDGEAKEGAHMRLRELIIENEETPRDKVIEMFEKEGFTMGPSRARLVHYETRATLRALRKMGKISGGGRSRSKKK